MDISKIGIRPYWWDAAPPQESNAVLPSRVDAVVVGSGCCGLSAAIALARHGCRTAVLDAGLLGGGASTLSGGMVSSGQKLVRASAVRGEARTRIDALLADSVASFHYLERLIAEEHLDAGYRRTGRYFAAYAPAHYEKLCRMGALLREKTGVTVHNIPRSLQDNITRTDFYHGGILVEDYGGLHPGLYTSALLELARKGGVSLHSHSKVLSISKGGAGFTVETVRGQIEARHVIVATNGYTGRESPFLRRRVIPVSSYQIATEELPTALMDEINPGRRMISDSQNELYFTRPSPDGKRIIFGTRPSIFNINERQAATRMAQRLQAVWPKLSSFAITHAWRGQVAMTFDKIAHMGRHDGVHYAVGCNGNGVALMTYLGHQTALKILGQQERACAFDTDVFPTEPFYHGGNPWFLPVVSAQYRIRDAIDRWRNA